MSFSIIIILFFISVIGIAVMAYFIAGAIIGHQETYYLHTVETAKNDLAKMETDLQHLRDNLTAAKRAYKLAEIKQNPNAIIIGYKDKPRKTRRNPNITIQGATHE